MSVPGIPCVYYGDEIADVGGNDPDNRRMMRFDNLNEEEKRTKQWTSDWASLRRSRMSMLYGTTTFEIVDEHVLHIQRTYLNEVTELYLNRDSQPHALPSDHAAATTLAGLLSTEGTLPAFGAVAFGTTL